MCLNDHLALGMENQGISLMSVCERRQLQEKQRCCSGVGCDQINMGQRQELMVGLEIRVKLEIRGHDELLGRRWTDGETSWKRSQNCPI